MGVHLGYVLFVLMEMPPVKLNARQVDTAKKMSLTNSLMVGDFTF